MTVVTITRKSVRSPAGPSWPSTTSSGPGRFDIDADTRRFIRRLLTWLQGRPKATAAAALYRAQVVKAVEDFGPLKPHHLAAIATWAREGEV
jgi:hypothetical protein